MIEFYYFDAQTSVDTVLWTSYHNSLLGFAEDYLYLKVTHTWVLTSSLHLKGIFDLYKNQLTENNAMLNLCVDSYPTLLLLFKTY